MLLFLKKKFFSFTLIYEFSCYRVTGGEFCFCGRYKLPGICRCVEEVNTTIVEVSEPCNCERSSENPDNESESDDSIIDVVGDVKPVLENGDFDFFIK